MLGITSRWVSEKLKRYQAKGDIGLIHECAVASFIVDEGGPLEVNLQRWASNHSKRLLLRVVVVSIREKFGKKNRTGIDQRDE
jgi:hypothetical protein